MESTTSQIESQIPQQPPLPDSCPISTLLSKRVVHMTDAELEAYVKDLRAMAESPQTLKKLASQGTTKLCTNTKKPRKASSNQQQMLAKLLEGL